MADPHVTPPRFIALEGCDGSGTTTQRSTLAAALRARGHDVVETAEPSNGRIGRMIRRMLSEPDTDRQQLALLFAADRLDHLAETIWPATQCGKIIITDRYLLSSWVYQSLDADFEWVRAINRFAGWPDLTFVLDVPASVAVRRIAARRGATEIFDATEVQERVAKRYSELAHGYAYAPVSMPNVVRIDGVDCPDLVTKSILAECFRRGL